MRVCLTRKLAERIDGVDLSCHDVGESFDLPEFEGRLLLAEEWAFLERRSVDRAEQKAPSGDARAVGADRPSGCSKRAR